MLNGILHNLMKIDPHNNGYFTDDDDDDEDDKDYGEYFTKHELNVYKCLKYTAKTNQQAYKSAVSDGSTKNVDESSKVDFQGTTKPLRDILPNKPDYEALRKYFAWLLVDRVKATLENTTQWFKAEGRMPMRKHFKTSFLQLM